MEDASITEEEDEEEDASLPEIRVVILDNSQSAKNRNLSRVISNLNRLNWSSEDNSVYCFSTVFTRLRQQEVSSTCLPRNFPCIVFDFIKTFLTYT